MREYVVVKPVKDAYGPKPNRVFTPGDRYTPPSEAEEKKLLEAGRIKPVEESRPTPHTEPTGEAPAASSPPSGPRGRKGKKRKGSK